MKINNEPKPILIALDFDNTAFKTFQAGNGLIDVETACRLAIGNIFGEDSTKIFDIQGGLRNRAGSELIRDLIYDPQFRAEEMIDRGLEFGVKNAQRLISYVPDGMGIPIQGQEFPPTELLTEVFIREKLYHLYHQIGKLMDNGRIWPEPTTGFISFWTEITKSNYGSEIFNTAIVSSGHQRFIERTFAVHGLVQPDVLVTEDDIRGQFPDLRSANLVKPSSFPLELAIRKWQAQPGFPDLNGSTNNDLKSKVLYLGDDIAKDGGCAQETNTLFGLYKPDLSPPFISNSTFFAFSDWREVTLRLKSVNSADSSQAISKAFL